MSGVAEQSPQGHAVLFRADTKQHFHREAGRRQQDSGGEKQKPFWRQEGGGILVLPAAPDKCPVENIQNHQIRAAQNRHGEEKAADAVTPPLGSGDEKNSGNRKAIDPHGIIGQRPNTERGVDIINKHCRRCPNARFFPQAKIQQQADAQMGSHIQIPEPQTDALCASVDP